MNKKIKELALDAGIGFTLWDDSGREMIDNYTPEEYLEKFAELIVKECITAIKNDDGYHLSVSTIDDRYNQGVQMGLEFAVTNIAEHFGVEE